MTQDIINKVFETDLGQPCNELYVTSDDNIFIRYKEAETHIDYLSEHGYDIDEKIEIWCQEY